MFNDLPTTIKKMIFSRVRHMDLFESCGVSREWWALTIATCSFTSSKYADFLKFQVQFCNEMMPKEEGWEDWMFVEFTDDKSIQLFDFPDKKMIEYLHGKGIQIQKLIYYSDPSIFPNLKKLFPHLETLYYIPRFYEYDGKAVVLPDGLEYLHLTINDVYPMPDLLEVFEHLERVDGLYLDNGRECLFEGISFNQLKYLHLDMYYQSTEDIKLLVTGSKQLSIVHLENGFIYEEWLGIFPKNIMKIQLKDMQLDNEMMPLFGTADAFVERQLMRFVCQDWTKIRLFKSSNWSSDIHYKHCYICRPQSFEEEIEINMFTSKIPYNLLASGKLQLKVLKLSEDIYTECDFNIIVPKSVQHFEWKANELADMDFAKVFEDISTLRTLRIDCCRNETIQASYFPYAINLVSLDISLVDDMILGSILRNCPSLKQLSLKCPQEMTFAKLPAEVKSFSVKQLKVTEPNDPFVNILGHFPSVVDLHLQDVNMATVTIADCAKLARMGFVRISFKNINDFVALLLLVVNLHFLSFSHFIMGYSRLDYSLANERFSCVMGREKAFLRRYSSSDSKHDFTEMNVRYLGDCFDCESLLYCKGLSSSHLSSSSESFKITYNLDEFIANGLFEIVQENNSH